MRGASKTGARRIDSRELERQAFEMRKAGHSYASISAATGVTRQAAHAAVTRVLKKLSEETNADAEHVRALELDRLDAILAGIWSAAIGGDVDAIDRVLRIMQRRAALEGLDVPREVIVKRMAGSVSDTEYTLMLGPGSSLSLTAQERAEDEQADG